MPPCAAHWSKRACSNRPDPDRSRNLFAISRCLGYLPDYDMTIRNTLAPVSSPAAATRGLVLTALVASLAGCGMISSVIDSDKVDYKSSAAKKPVALDVPPDLTQLAKDSRYGLPDNGRGIATASGFQQQRGTPAAAVAAGEAIGVTNTPAMHIERAGTQRWLVVKQTPEQLWPLVKQFWADNGFNLASESATTGIMETDWAENRGKIPQDFIRSALSKVADSMYSTGERDKFRTRLERTADGATEVYISHRGAEEVLTGAQKETTRWASRPNDPILEAQFLTKLMARLGSNGSVAKAAVADAPVQPLHAKLVTTPSKLVEVDEGFDRAWRRVGLALDRVGFTVEDRDRTKGTYFVRFVDPDAVASDGFFAKLFSFGASSDKAKEAQRYRILVAATPGATVSNVTVQNNEGKPEATPTGDKILNLLQEQLK
jgi:outer membrane protein assembly factor BamC